MTNSASSIITFSECLDLSIWNEFQNSLSTLLNIPIALYDVNGSPLSLPGSRDAVCDIIKSQTARGAELYRDSHKKAIAKALQRGEPYIYRCFTNEHIFVIPVKLDSNLSAAIISGHVYLSEDDFKEFIKRASDFGIQGATIQELEKKVKVVQPHDFFTRPSIVRALAVPLLRGLYQKGYYEKRFYQIQSVLEAAAPSFLPDRREDMYRYVFNAMAVLFDVDTACVLERYDTQAYRAVAAFGRRKDLVSAWTASDSLNIIKRVVTDRRPEACDSISDMQKIGLPEGITSIHIFPMTIGDNVFGLLCVFNTRIPRETVKLLSLLANQISFVIEGMKAEEHLKKKIEGFDVLEEVYKTIAPMLNQEELYNTILYKSTELVGAEQGSLMILSGENTLDVKAAKGIDKSILENIKVKPGEGISGAVIEKGEPIMAKDIESDAALFVRKSRPRYRTKSFISIPLKIGSRTIGVLNISDKITGEVFSKEDMHLLLSFAYYASIALERGTYYKMTEDLKKLSITDTLTGLFNRRYFQERLFEEAERSKRHNELFTLFVMDIDDFKAFNDTYGHLAGDEALKKVAHAIVDGIRAIDVATRFGGEEFSIILPYTTKASSYAIAERIRRNVQDIRFFGKDIPPDHVMSISIGVAEFPSDADAAENLINRADRAMYLAKARGKNRIVGYGQ